MPRADFGVDSELSLPDDGETQWIGCPSGVPLDDPIAATRAALTDPLDFPPLRQCVIPGDTVTIALGESLVQPEALIAGAIMELLEAEIKPEAITVLRHPADAKLTRRSPTRRLPSRIRDKVTVTVHDPTCRDQLAMLNVSSDNLPIYMNRAIVEADLVLPIGPVRPSESLGYLGSQSTLFPSYTNHETLRKFLKPRSVRLHKFRERRIKELREAVWLLGTRLIVEAVAGPSGQLMEIVAGDVDSVDRRSHEVLDAVWKDEVPHRASLVIAAVPGRREQQSWANVARALDAALRVVQDDGTIAICCDLRAKPGKSLKRLTKAHSLEDLLHTVDRDATPDALAASQLARALQRANVYLLSQLDEDLVQSLGFAYIESVEEVGRLAASHESRIVLENAQQANPTVTAEIIS